jgi:hypothetical protein
MCFISIKMHVIVCLCVCVCVNVPRNSVTRPVDGQGRYNLVSKLSNVSE